MLRSNSANAALLAMGLDAGAVCLALAVAAWLRPQLNAWLPFAAEYPYYLPAPLSLYLAFSLEWLLLGQLTGIYDARRNLRLSETFAHLTLTALLATVALAGTLYLSYREISRLLFLVFIALAYLLMLAWRGVQRWLWRGRRQPRRLLLIGSAPAAQELLAAAQAEPHWGLQVAHTLSEATPDLPAAACRAVQEQAIEDVVIALPGQAYQTMEALVVALHRLPVRVWVIPDYFRLALHKAAVAEFAGLPLLDLRAPALSESQRLVKRAFDLLVCVGLLPLALPLMGLIALAIRLETPGPALLRQRRVGENGRLFTMLKFRTMRLESESLTAPATRSTAESSGEEGEDFYHKRPDDPRVTRLGRFLRRSSLDELPQLFNVLKGEMSLVGPRPELPALVERYADWQRRRFVVPQGLTGWWQVNGRSDRPMHLNTQDDLYYIQNYSLWLDLYILLKTIGAVLSGRGAF